MSLKFEKRCEVWQSEIRAGSVAGVGSHELHNAGESTIEGQRKAGTGVNPPRA